jgi:PKD repeat protein
MRHHYLWSIIVVCAAGIRVDASTDWQAIVCNEGTDEVCQITLPIGQDPALESTIPWITGPNAVVITPEASQAVVTAFAGVSGPSNPDIYSLDLTTYPPSVITSRIISQPTGSVALTPDGSKIYLIDSGYNVDILKTTDLSPVDTIPSFEFDSATLVAIALSPNKAEGYLTTNDSWIAVINTSTNTVSPSWYDLPPGVTSGQIAVSPDGSALYVTDPTSNIIYQVIVSDGTVNIITGAADTLSNDIAVAPDGTAIYALQNGATGGTGNMLLKVNTATNVSSSFPVPNEVAYPASLAITPDGEMACITDGGDIHGAQAPGQYIAFLDTTTGEEIISPLQLSSSDDSSLAQVSVTPDPAPTAWFTYSVYKETASFDASSSSSPRGQVVVYAWDFGDGQTVTTTFPTISHAYSSGGSFSVALTVTNTAGTSTEVTYTGHMVSNNGGSSARNVQEVAISNPGVAAFNGKVYRNTKKKKLTLKTTWSKSLVPYAKKYVVFARGKKIATIKAHKKREKIIKLHPHGFPLFISYDYRQYLNHKYSICVIDRFGHVSRSTFLHVSH